MTKRELFKSAFAAWSIPGISFARKSTAYEELGIRPVINFQGTMTTLGASKMAPEVNSAMAEASREYVMLGELHDTVAARLAKLCGTDSAMVTSGAAAAIALGTYGCLTGEDSDRVRRLPDLTGMKPEAVILKAHRNGYDHAVRSAGLKIVEAENREQLASALGARTAVMYYLGGTSHDWEWEQPVALEECVKLCRAAGVPLLVDAANMLPPWDNIHKLSALGVDLIAVSGGKHIRGPQSSGILAGRAPLIRAARMNSSPNSDSQGRGMKVNREEMIGLWMAVERYAKLDFAALDRECARQADYLSAEFRKLGLKTEKAPFDRTRRVHRVRVSWEPGRWKHTPEEVERLLLAGDPRIAVLRHNGVIEFTVLVNDPGDERIAASRMREIFA